MHVKFLEDVTAWITRYRIDRSSQDAQSMIYTGWIADDGEYFVFKVRGDRAPETLNPRFDLWGDLTGGSAQLALAILADHLNNDDRAMKLHQTFKEHVVPRLSLKEWILYSDDIKKVLDSIEKQ